MAIVIELISSCPELETLCSFVLVMIMAPCCGLDAHDNDDSMIMKKTSQCRSFNTNHPYHSEDRGWTWADIAEVLLKSRRG